MAVQVPLGWPALLPLVVVAATSLVSTNTYIDDLRKELLLKEKTMRLGMSVEMKGQEKKVNKYLMGLKSGEVEEAKETLQFPPSMHFFWAKSLIENSKVFHILQKMPKGAALHLHEFSLVSTEWVVKNITYRPHCYFCATQRGDLLFKFANPPPRNPKTRECSQWFSMEELRKKMKPKDVIEFDKSLQRVFSLVTKNPERTYSSQDALRTKLQRIFMSISGLVLHAPVFKDYIFQALKEFYQDKVLFLEIRTRLMPVYELDGQIHDALWMVKAYQEAVVKFRAIHPEFMGLRLILSESKSKSVALVTDAIVQTIILRRRFPDMVAGFDLVGWEDTGHSLYFYKEALMIPHKYGVRLPYFLHAGETDWYGTQADTNLVDAVIMNATRIGHGFALTKHPVVTAYARAKDIPIEVCPISNQVMKLVSDLRNHPAAALMAQGYPMVISSDNPAVHGAKGLSYDFYEAFMGIGGRSADLRTLKLLIMNSIKYSSLPKAEKDFFMNAWAVEWDHFIEGLARKLA
ncbi:Adenosine deaminase CECR1 [Heterocephalus glaber]|uniref:Adenosine deaminase 2 n=1 Tax=Heterocephalus glaber TaxID=10181 RepID=G5BT23_HETGA|nr:adenosine deaminase CECR1 [Heterocephalus glaber]EHB12434.1 Adenosine deaminase CECR1 [Heterocephalus glaber]